MQEQGKTDKITQRKKTRARDPKVLRRFTTRSG